MDLVLHFSVRDILYHLYFNLTFCCLTKKMSDIIRYAELDNWMIRNSIVTICFRVDKALIKIQIVMFPQQLLPLAVLQKLHLLESPPR